MFKTILAKKCDDCRKPGVKISIPVAAQSKELYEKNLYLRGDGEMLLCNECHLKEIKRRELEYEEQELQVIQDKHREYVAALRLLVELTELEAKAMELGIDVKKLKSEFGII